MNSLLMLNVYQQDADNLDMNAIVTEFILCSDVRNVKIHFILLC